MRPQLLQMRYQRRHPVIAQAAGVESRRRERRAQRVHLGERRQVRGVAEVVRVRPAREARAGRGLDGDDAHLAAAAQLRAQEREDDPGEVRAAAGAADDHVGVVVRHLHLREGLLSDHRLVQQHVVQHAAERVLGVVALRGHLDRLRDRDAEAAGMVGTLRENRAARLRFRRRRGDAAGAVGLHQRAPVGLLVVRDADHEHLHVESEERAGECERAAPLAGAGLRATAASRPPPCCRRPAPPRCSACGCPRAIRPRTCSRCARASAARARAGARGRAASDATAGRRRAPAPGSRSRAPSRPPAGSAPSETAARGRRARSACACPGAAPAAAASAGRPAGCTRSSESSIRRGGT